MKGTSVGSEKIVETTARTVLLSVLCFVIGLYVIATLMHNRSAFPSIDLENQEAVYTVTEADGTKTTVTGGRAPLVTYGETLTVTLSPLGETEDTELIQNGMLVVSLYHCYVKVYSGESLLYEQTDPEEGQIIGHRYYLVPLPEGYENETITIVAACAENGIFSFLQNGRIVPADRVTYAFRNSHFATGILLISLLIVSIFMMILSTVTRVLEKRNDGLFSISFLSASVCLWFMGFAGYFQPFVESTTFLAVAEYVGLCLLPISLSFFCQSHTSSRGLRTFCIAVTVFLTIFFVVATIETIFVPGVSYVNYVRQIQIFFLFTMVILLAGEIREFMRVKEIGERTLIGGVMVAVTLGIIELVRFVLSDPLSSLFPWIRRSLMPVCILSLAFTVIMYYGIRGTQNQYRRIEQENLKKLAFIDQLTGAPNRAACYRRFDEMRKNNVTDFVITFIDINFLKKTNDTWGHEKGDELIRTACELLRKHFSGNDFFARWGGDEFIALHFGTLDETKAIMDQIQNEVDALNASGTKDFTLSASWGFGESTNAYPKAPEEAIRQADRNMYTMKEQAHAARA